MRTERAAAAICPLRARTMSLSAIEPA